MATPSGPSKTFGIPENSLASRPKDPPAGEWIGRILATRDGLDAEKIDRLAVSAGPNRSKTTRIVTLRIRVDTTPERLISDIDAAIRTSGHRFAKVEAFRAGDKSPEFTRGWDVPVDDEEPDDPEPEIGRDSVPSAYAGLLRQAHSHVDRYLTAFQGMVGETLQHHRETNVELRREAADLRRENAELSRLLSTREDERADRQVRVAREGAIVSAFQNIVTALAIRLSARGETIPAHFIQLLEGLSEEQQDAIVSVLKDDQKAVIAAIFKTVKERSQ